MHVFFLESFELRTKLSDLKICFFTGPFYLYNTVYIKISVPVLISLLVVSWLIKTRCVNFKCLKITLILITSLSNSKSCDTVDWECICSTDHLGLSRSTILSLYNN